MKIVQWNIQSYNTNSEELKLLIHELGNPEVICLQETALGLQPMYTPANYIVQRFFAEKRLNRTKNCEQATNWYITSLGHEYCEKKVYHPSP